MKNAVGLTSSAMISWVDLTPTILDIAGIESFIENQNIYKYSLVVLIFLNLDCE